MDSSLEEVLNRAQNAIQRAKSLTQRWSEGPSVLLGGHLGPQSPDLQPSHPQSSENRPISEHRPFLPSPLPSFSATLSSPDHPHSQHHSNSSDDTSSGSPPSLMFPSGTASTSTTAAAAAQAPAPANWIDRLRARRAGMMNAAPVPIHCPCSPSSSLHRGHGGERAGSVPNADLEPQFVSHRGWQDEESVHSMGTSSLMRADCSQTGSPQRHEGEAGDVQGGADTEAFRERFDAGQGRLDEAEHVGSGAGAQAVAEVHAGESNTSGNDGRGYEDGRDWRPSVAQPFLQVARNLASLQQQQSNTLNQLLSLRLKQLRLRQQQLASLQELLQAEYEAVQGTPLQVSAVQQALQLLSQSLEDMDLAATAITASRALDDVGSVAQTVARADARAEDTARMARQLLGVLREFPRRMEDLLQNVMEAPAPSRGASELEVVQVPLVTCSSTHPLVGEPCPICLSDFRPMDDLKCLDCCHFYHASCMDQWLRIKANCPLCMHPLRNEEASSQQEDRDGGQQEGFLLGEPTFEVPLFPGPVTSVSLREREPPSLARALRSAAALRLSLSGLVDSSISAARAAAEGGSRGHVQGSTASEAGGPGDARGTSAAHSIPGFELSTGFETRQPTTGAVAYPTQPSLGPSAARQSSSSSSSDSPPADFVVGGDDRNAAMHQQAPESALLGGGAAAGDNPEPTPNQPMTSIIQSSGNQHAPPSAAQESFRRRFSGTGDDILSFGPEDVALHPPARDVALRPPSSNSLQQQGLQPSALCPASSQVSEGDTVLRLTEDEQPAHRSAPAASGDVARNGPMVNEDVGLAQAMHRARAWLGLHYPEC